MIEPQQCSWCEAPADRHLTVENGFVSTVTDYRTGIRPARMVPACRECAQRIKRKSPALARETVRQRSVWYGRLQTKLF